MVDEFKGFSLFNDVEDEALRNRNRAVVLANIAEDHSKLKKLSIKGAALVAGYFQKIPDEAKQAVLKLFQQNMKERGFVFTG